MRRKSWRHSIGSTCGRLSQKVRFDLWDARFLSQKRCEKVIIVSARRGGLTLVGITTSVLVAACAASTGAPRTAGARPTSSNTTPSWCYLLSRAQVRGALRQPIEPAAGTPGSCVYRLTSGAGGVNFGVFTGTTEQARTYFRQQKTADSGTTSLTVRRLPGLGEQALAVISHSQGETILILLKNKVLSLTVSWPAASQKPDMGISLARQALTKL